jgi:hypothetical protein
MTTTAEIEISRKPALLSAAGAIILAAATWQSAAWLALIVLATGLVLAAMLALLSAIPRDADDIAARYFAELAACGAAPDKPVDATPATDAQFLAI